MPQSDKHTFLSIIFWTLTLYVAGYLFFNASVFFSLLNNVKNELVEQKQALKKGAAATI